MELRKTPGTWFDSRTTWLARTAARRAGLLSHWNVSDSSFPVRIVNAALHPWLPFLGATVDPSDADQLCLEHHHLEFYFLGAFVASDVNVRRVENGAAFVLETAQWHANLEGSECLRARDCGRAHRDRPRCEWEARRRVCLVVVRLWSGRSVIAWWDSVGFLCSSAHYSLRRTATVAAANPILR